MYYEISNSRQKQCLSIYTRNVNKLGPAKFRTQAHNGTEQVCYYNRNKKDTCFNSFLVVRKQTVSSLEINFSTVKVIDNKNRQNAIYSEISDELRDFKNDNVQQTIRWAGENNFGRGKPEPAEFVGGEPKHERGDRRQQQNTVGGRVSKKPRFLSG